MNEVNNIIQEIQDICQKDAPVFRGERKKYESPEKPASSLIYRELNKFKNSSKKFNYHEPDKIEEKILDKARRERFFQGKSNIEILTELRHFDGDTAVVDFSRDMFVALFFACSGKMDEDGVVWCLDAKNIKEIEDKEFEKLYDDKREKDELILITPTQIGLSQNRVNAQSSVFIHTRQGFVDEDKMKGINIPSRLKKDCLEYLKKFHNISHSKIYNDTIGFIQNIKTLRNKFYRIESSKHRKETKMRPDLIVDTVYWEMEEMSQDKLAKKIASSSYHLKLLNKHKNSLKRIKQEVVYPFSISRSLEAMAEYQDQDFLRNVFNEAFSIFGEKIDKELEKIIGNKEEIEKSKPQWSSLKIRQSSVTTGDRTDWYINSFLDFEPLEKRHDYNMEMNRIVLPRIVMLTDGRFREE